MTTIQNTFLLYFILVMLLSSCATLPPEAPAVKQAWKNRQIEAKQISSWHINGKIAILTARDSGSATVDWMQNHQQFVIELFGPLGMNALKLTGQPGLVTLKTADGKSFYCKQSRTIASKTMGLETAGFKFKVLDTRLACSWYT